MQYTHHHTLTVHPLSENENHMCTTMYTFIQFYCTSAVHPLLRAKVFSSASSLAFLSAARRISSSLEEDEEGGCGRVNKECHKAENKAMTSHMQQVQWDCHIDMMLVSTGARPGGNCVDKLLVQYDCSTRDDCVPNLGTSTHTYIHTYVRTYSICHTSTQFKPSQSTYVRTYVLNFIIHK